MYLVRIVTAFVALGACQKIGATNTVAAARRHAIGVAGVVIVLVAIITKLAIIDVAITTSLQAAIGGTAIIGSVVAIVAGFICSLSWLKIQTPHPITASGRQTVVVASVCRDAVSIITGLIAVSAFSDIGATNRVAASRRGAGCRASVCRHVVAIIADLVSDIALGEVGA